MNKETVFKTLMVITMLGSLAFSSSTYNKLNEVKATGAKATEINSTEVNAQVGRFIPWGDEYILDTVTGALYSPKDEDNERNNNEFNVVRRMKPIIP